ncbi:MAG: acetylxylan esterase [Kiritimatiellae bacterium]|nr:acetylxylan esterase [Kiritimatiellia bacterium]
MKLRISAAVLALSGVAVAAPWIKGETDKDPLSYRAGETMTFTLSLQEASAEGREIAWRRTGDDGRVETGRGSAAGPVVVKTSLACPGFVRLVAELVPVGAPQPVRSTRASWADAVYFEGGAAVDPGSLRQTKPEPKDFDAFWSRRKAELAAVPMEATLEEIPSPTVGVRLYKASITCAGPRPATGYLSVPEAKGKYPASIRFYGYGHSWSSDATDPPKSVPRERMELLLSAHGFELGRDRAYYRDFAKSVRSNGYGHAFDPVQNAKPETSYFGAMAWRVMRGTEYLKSRPEWNGRDLTVQGGSQGSLQAMWAAALVPGVSRAVIHIPWCCDVGGYENGREFGDWHIEWAPGLDYYDQVNMAKRVPSSCTVEISRIGLGDYVAPPSGAAVMYNSLTCPKRATWVQGSQHTYVPPKARKIKWSAPAAGASASSGGDAGWERPRTTRRYLHPPFAERMFVLWNDAKISFAEVGHSKDWRKRHYFTEESDACWFFHGDGGALFDFKAAKNIVPADGTPVHGLEWDLAGVKVRLEACCDCTRKSTCFGRFSVENGSGAGFSEKFAIRLRHGREVELLGGHDNGLGAPDFYGPYASHPETWAKMPVDWKRCADGLKSDGGRFMAFAPCPAGAQWDAAKGELAFAIDLKPGESRSFDFTLGMGDAVRPDFASARTATERWWREELSKIDRLPPALAADPGRLRLVQNLTVQMLQCFSRPVGKDYALPRQGGLQRWVWPWDNMEALAALVKVGRFDDYVREAISFYFDEYGNVYDGAESGRIGPFGIDWDCNTANVLGILGRYCHDSGDAATWNRYRARALEGFRWVMRHRVKPGAAGGLQPGLFPPGRASDYKGAAQVWAFTDGENLKGLSFYLDAAERFSDPALDEIRAGIADYAKAFGGVIERARRDCESRDELYLPLTPDGTDGANLKKGYPRLYHGLVMAMGLRFGLVDATDVVRVWRSCCRLGYCNAERGLTANLPPYNDLDSTHYWYTTSQDKLWHKVFLGIGQKALADRILAGTIRNSMSEEFYLGERYRDDNPWYLPWSPNCSGSGRVIQMLLEDAACKAGASDEARLAAAAAADYAVPVRPGGEGRPFWNGHSVRFLYPPAFDFAAVPGAAKYRFDVTDGAGRRHSFEASSPTAALSPVWNALPVGYVEVSVAGVDAQGRVLGEAGRRRFWRGAGYSPGSYRKRPWSYMECVRRYYPVLLAHGNTRHFLEHGTPDGVTDLFNIYPSKMNSALITGMLRCAKLDPAHRDDAMKIAIAAGDYMISISQKADAPLAFFPPTYWKMEGQKTNFASVRYAGQNMLVYPAVMGSAYLKLYAACGERRFLDAALGIAATYRRLQLPEGTWYLKMWEKDGAPFIGGDGDRPVRLIPIQVCEFMEQLADATGDDAWRAVAARAFAYIENGPLRTWDWAAQFEDTKPSAGWRNHSSCDAMRVAHYLMTHHPHDAARLRIARDLVRWVEDQFVFWRKPSDPDGRCVLVGGDNEFGPWVPNEGRADFSEWPEDLPGVTEKYRWMMMENALATMMMTVYVDLYRLEGDELALAKARTLGDSIVRVQQMGGDGEIASEWRKPYFVGSRCPHIWMNCSVHTVTQLEDLAPLLDGDSR